MQRKYFPLVFVMGINDDDGITSPYGFGHDTPEAAHQFALEEIVPNPIKRFPDGTGAYRKYTYQVQGLWVFPQPTTDDQG